MKFFAIVFMLHTVPLIFGGKPTPKGRSIPGAACLSWCNSKSLQSAPFCAGCKIFTTTTKGLGSTVQRLQMIAVPQLGENVHVTQINNNLKTTDDKADKCSNLRNKCINDCPKYPPMLCTIYPIQYNVCEEKCTAEWNCELTNTNDLDLLFNLIEK